jgi:hypothetical protein
MLRTVVWGDLPLVCMEHHPHSPGDTRAPDTWPVDVPALLRAARDMADGRVGATEAWRGEATFTILQRGERNTVLRAAFAVPGGETRRVVLKLFGDDGDLADADWCCMQALSGTGVVPDVVAESSDARGFAMADVGDETFERVLAEGSASDAMQVVARMASAYARLHVEGRALVARTEALRSSALTGELSRWMDGLPRALAWLQLTERDARVRRALARVMQVWYAGRDAVTLTQGDPAPGNVLLHADGTVRLVDFEYAAARHPAFDLAAWDVICPLPNEAVQLFRAHYAEARAALGWPLAEGEDEAAYAAILTHQALALLSWLPTTAREHDVPWVASWSARQAVLGTLERLATRARADTALQPLADAADQAAASWRRAWPEVGEALLPPWPAFRGAIA